MTPRSPNLSLVSCVLLVLCTTSAHGQVIESVGSRALGMGGAFVAVASDSSATWWNPAGLAAGPFLDVAIAHATTELPDASQARRDHSSWFALGTPPVGLSFYKLQATQVRTFGVPDGAGGGGPRAQAASWSGTQLGVTVVQTLTSGVHVGGTLKYLRGTFRTNPQIGPGTPATLLDRGDTLKGGEAENHVDVDLGLLAIAGAMRFGAVVRNLHEPHFAGDQFTLARQMRVGAALNGEELDATPFIISLDADVLRYASASGDRRVIAVGAERWLGPRRLAIRAGGRLNTVGAREHSATVGASFALRAGMYVDGHAVRGGAADDRGWGVAARVSF
jgi:hypothetical protein